MKLSQQLSWRSLTVGRSFGAAGSCSCSSSSSTSSASLRAARRRSPSGWLQELAIADCRHTSNSQARSTRCRAVCPARQSTCLRWRFVYAHTLRVGGLVKDTWPIVSCMRGVSCHALIVVGDSGQDMMCAPSPSERGVGGGASGAALRHARLRMLL